jgi:hypothetical protein
MQDNKRRDKGFTVNVGKKGHQETIAFQELGSVT